jgi:hypothetical protein
MNALHGIIDIREQENPMKSLASKMAALKKGMRAAGLETEECVWFCIRDARSKANMVPSYLRKLGGKLYLSRPVRTCLKGKEEWPDSILQLMN